MFEWSCRVVASLIFPGITRKIDIECVVWLAQTFQKTTATQVQAFLAPEWVAWKGRAEMRAVDCGPGRQTVTHGCHRSIAKPQTLQAALAVTLVPSAGHSEYGTLGG